MVRNGRASAGGFFRDFRDFALKGNVVDLAVAVIIGGAFGQIVTSFIEDIITPALLNPAMEAAGVEQIEGLTFNGIRYGSFLAAVLNFVVIAFVIFLMVRSIEATRRRVQRQEAIAEEAAPDPAVVAQERLVDSLDRLTQTIEARNP